MMEMHGDAVKAAIGTGLEAKTSAHHIEFIFSWLTIALIAIGIIVTLISYRFKIFAATGNKHNYGIAVRNIDFEFFAFSVACCLIILAATILPFVSKAYDMGRTYFQMMIVLSTFFVIGGASIARALRVRQTYLPIIILIAVLVPYFLCTSGTMYHLFSFPKKMMLNDAGYEYSRFFVHEEDVYSIEWLKEYGNNDRKIYSWDISQDVLISQGSYSKYSGVSRLKIFELDRKPEGYTCLRYTDISPGGIVERSPETFEDLSIIYTNGKSEIRN
jgi:uncharacterized membrane protein